MANWQGVPAVTGQDMVLSLGEVLASAKASGSLKELLQKAAVDNLLVKAGRQAGITVSVEELQAGANRFRSTQGLHSAERTRAWLQQRGLAVADFEVTIERSLLLEKLMARIPAADVAALFEKERGLYARVRLRHILVSSEGAAQELLARLTEEAADFGELAREFSLDPAARRNGGDLGVVQRRQLPPSLGEPIFAASPGQIVGPLATERGLQLLRVDEFLPAALDEASARHIRQQLFDGWLRQEVQKQRFTFPLLDQV